MYSISVTLVAFECVGGIPGDGRESHTHIEFAGSAGSVYLSHPSTSAHTPELYLSL